MPYPEDINDKEKKRIDEARKILCDSIWNQRKREKELYLNKKLIEFV